MTEERSNSDSVEDALVSRTYREAAVEQVPDELDQAVLQRARQRSSNRYSRSVVWLRPMAWAATIGLCLAIVVEINNVPQPTREQIALPAASADAMAPVERVREEAAPARSVQGGTGTTNMNKSVSHETEALQQRTKKTVDAKGRVSLQNVPQHSKSDAGESAFAPPEVTESLKLKDNRESMPLMLEEADGASGFQSISGTANYANTPSPASLEVTAPACNPKARTTPQTWLECIEALEENDLDDLAGEQRDQLRKAFPDFDSR